MSTGVLISVGVVLLLVGLVLLAVALEWGNGP